MVRVFTGKVVISGDQLEQYLIALKEAEEARAPFRDYLEQLNREFHDYLCSRYALRTASKHAATVEIFIDFLCAHTDVETIEGITRGIANTHFRKWYKRKVWDNATGQDLEVGLRKFFQFLASEKGMENPKVMAGLK